MIVDVRTREEYVKSHVKGALNLPLFDLEYYTDFLKNKEVLLYCDTGHRAAMAAEFLGKQGIKASIIPAEELAKQEREGKPLICAINYLSVKPGMKKEFDEKVKELCRIATGVKGFLGSKIFVVSAISYGGSGLQGEYRDINVEPTKYVMLTYWTSKKAHEEFHKQAAIMEGFTGLLRYLSIMPTKNTAKSSDNTPDNTPESRNLLSVNWSSEVN